MGVGAHWGGVEALPSCEAIGPDGTRIVIRPHAMTDSVADLARALDLPVTTPLAIDDRPVAQTERLVATGLRIGSSISIDATTPPRERGHSGVEVAVGVGPACERWMALPPGRHTVGRATTAAVRVDDPAVELHHGILDVATDGTVTFTQLTGPFPAMVAGVPCRRSHRVDGNLSMGSSRLLIGRDIETTDPTGSIAPAERDPWRRVVRRGPDAGAGSPLPRIAIPGPAAIHRAPPLTTLVGAGVGALGAGVLAGLLGQLLFALFAAVGAVASLATWAIGAMVARRDRRRCAAQHQRAVADFRGALTRARAAAEHNHRVRHRGVVGSLDRIHHDQGGLWSCRPDPDEALWVAIGRGTCRWAPPVDVDDRARLDAELLLAIESCERFDDVAVPLALDATSTIALHGSSTVTESLCRSMIIQLAADYGPADWELHVVSEDPRRWSWVGWLPQAQHHRGVVAATDVAGLAAAMGRCSDADRPGRRTVIVVDAPWLLSARTSAVRRRLDRGGATCIAIVAAGATVPAVANRVLEVSETGAARWIAAGGETWTTVDRDIAVAGISSTTAEAAARRLAPLLDPENDDERALPSSVALGDVEPIEGDTAAAIARRWRDGGADPSPVACIGASSDGVVEIDLARDGPHGLIAGTTGSGKSELLRTLVASLAARSSPDHVTMILVDYKGGSTFDACERLPHTVGVVTDLDDGLAERVLVSLEAEVRRRERLLRNAGADDLAAYRRAAAEPLPRLVVVIDEFATLAKELPGFLGALVSIAQRGRSLGIHLVLATQRPAGVVTDDIRANTNLRLALRLQHGAEAHDVVGDVAPARFPPGTAGRAALRLGPDELIVFQVADSSRPVRPVPMRLTVERVRPDADVGSDGSSGAGSPTALELLVDAIGSAAAMVGTAAPHRPWVDALPAVLHRRDLGGDDTAVGLLDDPAEQCRRPVRWEPEDGTLLLVGAIGSGTTTAAAVVAARCVRNVDRDAMHLYVVDAQGAGVWEAFEASARCGAVVRVTETERIARLLGRLADELDRRSSGAPCEPTVVIVIDGYAAVRDAVADVVHGETARRLDRLLRDGQAVGMVAVVTTDGGSPAALALPRAVTWRFAGVPGRMRVVESGLVGQIVFDLDAVNDLASADAADPTAGSAGRPAPVLVLPEVVDPDEFDARLADVWPERSPRSPIELPIGLGALDLEPSCLRLPDGDHVFIGGGARTGRSTALRQVEFAWRRAHPDGRVIHVDRSRPVADVDDAGPVLVVVDDAERVDDPSGVLTRLLACPGTTFAVAARLDAVRVAYGHWTREVARSRCGLIMTAMGDVDGELLGVTLPRRSLIPPRPGLAWIIDHHGQRLVQVAARMPT